MSHGKQICVDYIGCEFNENKGGVWMLELMQYAVKCANVREVHAHVEEFDGSQSPPGFAAVVLLDESHVSAHCYYGKGLLAIDAFTCGGTDPSAMVADLKTVLDSEIPDLVLMQEQKVNRFLHSED